MEEARADPRPPGTGGPGAGVGGTGGDATKVPLTEGNTVTEPLASSEKEELVKSAPSSTSITKEQSQEEIRTLKVRLLVNCCFNPVSPNFM